MDMLLITSVTRDNVDVKVGDLLTARLSVINDNIRCFTAKDFTQLCIGSLHNVHHMGEGFYRTICESGVGFIADDQGMPFVDWIDIKDDKAQLVLVKFYTGDGSIPDFGENRFHGTPQRHCTTQVSSRKRIVGVKGIEQRSQMYYYLGGGRPTSGFPLFFGR
jgi:hypothetical protein